MDAVAASDKMALQSYGRPYDASGKPTGTYYGACVLPLDAVADGRTPRRTRKVVSDARAAMNASQQKKTLTAYSSTMVRVRRRRPKEDARGAGVVVALVLPPRVCFPLLCPVRLARRLRGPLHPLTRQRPRRASPVR